MKVFISWSGDRSRIVAETLRDWVREVIQSVTPFVSTTDIGAGARWGEELDSELMTSKFGIVCITPENLDSRWLNYEAGAIGKAVGTSRVVPYLIGMTERTEFVNSPLTRFQAKLALTDTLDVVKSLNEATDQPLDTILLKKTFDRAWPDLKSVLENLPSPAKATAKPDNDAILREILETVRGLSWSHIPDPHVDLSSRVNMKSAYLAEIAEVADRLLTLDEIRIGRLDLDGGNLVASTKKSGVGFAALVTMRDMPGSIPTLAHALAEEVRRKWAGLAGVVAMDQALS